MEATAKIVDGEISGWLASIDFKSKSAVP